MFHRIYLHVATMLIVSSAILVSLIGVGAYFELRQQVVQSAESSLTSALPEIEEATRQGIVEDSIRHSTQQDTKDHDSGTAKDDPADHHIQPTDERDQNIFFYSVTRQEVISQSASTPIPLKVILAHTVRPVHFSMFYYNRQPYLSYKTTYTWNGAPYAILLYIKTRGVRETLEQVLKVILVTGTLGILVSILMNLLLARRAIRPVRNTWNAYQETMTELSHELQTPLATIGALVSGTSVEPQIRRALEKEIDNASQMVRDILFLSRLETTLEEHALVPVAVSDLTEEVAQRFSKLAEGRGLTIQGTATAGLFVHTTPERWTRLVSTAFKNVVDHARESSRATWSLQAADFDVVFTVVNEAAIPLQGDAITKSATDHSRGFGLRIMERLAEDMKGTAELHRSTDMVRLRVRVPRLIGLDG